MDEYTLAGRVHSVGLAEAYFSSDQLADQGLAANARLLIVRVDKDDPGDLPVGLVWAERVRITLAEPAAAHDGG